MKAIKLMSFILVFVMILTCFAACAGSQGEKGEKGDKGDPGIQGEQGLQGEKGEKGDKGDKGDPGIQGEQGLQGEKGEKGDKGDKGDPGIQGEQGLRGEKGDKGEPGEQGEQGVQGEPGEDGRTTEFRDMDGWIQWKYVDEEDSEWKNLYEYGPTINHVYFPVPEGTASAWISTYSSTDNYGLAGAYTIIDRKEFAQGTSIKLTATVNDGYCFEGWYIENECISKELEYEYTVSSHNVNIEARYAFYSLTVTSWTDDNGAAGTYTSMSNKKVVPDTAVELTATVNEGYTFEGWFIDNRCVSNSLTYSYKMTDSNKTVEARYSSYTVNTSSRNNVANVAGTYTNLYNKKVAVGDTVTLVATVNEGYNFEGWYIDDVCVSRSLIYTYTMERRSVEICAKYTNYTVNSLGVAVNAKGEVAGEFAAGTYTKYTYDPISAGTTVTLIATVNDGYNFVGWYVDDACVSTSLEYTFTMGKADVEIEARYIYYVLNTWAEHYSTIGLNGWREFDNSELCISSVYRSKPTSIGEEITVTAFDVEGHIFAGWYVGDTVVCQDKTYTFIMPAGNVDLRAHYEDE